MKLPPPHAFDLDTTDKDKRRSSYFDRVLVGRIEVESRYNQEQELALMAVWMRQLPDRFSEMIEQVYCDSEQVWQFTVTLRSRYARMNRQIHRKLAESLDRLMCELNGGHNGITIRNNRNEILDEFGPDWGAHSDGHESGGYQRYDEDATEGRRRSLT